MNYKQMLEERPLVSLIIMCAAVLSFVIPTIIGLYEIRVSNIREQYENKISILEIKHQQEIDRLKFTTKYYKVSGKCSGSPRIDLLIYLDNPEMNGQPSLQEQPWAVSVNGGEPAQDFEAEFKNLSQGNHSIDIYANFPGNNPALIDVKLIEVTLDWNQKKLSESVIKSYIVDNYSRLQLIEPSGMHHRKSLTFTY